MAPTPGRLRCAGDAVVVVDKAAVAVAVVAPASEILTSAEDR